VLLQIAELDEGASAVGKVTFVGSFACEEKEETEIAISHRMSARWLSPLSSLSSSSWITRVFATIIFPPRRNFNYSSAAPLVLTPAHDFANPLIVLGVNYFFIHLAATRSPLPVAAAFFSSPLFSHLTLFYSLLNARLACLCNISIWARIPFRVFSLSLSTQSSFLLVLL
jgi:hypothetical protein